MANKAREMAFSELPDNRGRVYIPETGKHPRKKSCRDCFACQWCSDDRCLICRQGCCLEKKEEQGK
jgi:hypothetical protein